MRTYVNFHSILEDTEQFLAPEIEGNVAGIGVKSQLVREGKRSGSRPGPPVGQAHDIIDPGFGIYLQVQDLRVVVDVNVGSGMLELLIMHVAPAAEQVDGQDGRVGNVCFSSLLLSSGSSGITLATE